MALAKLLPDLYGLSDQYAPDGRITFGYINATPGSSNTVPGRLELTVDIRHPDEASYSAMLEAYSHVVVQQQFSFWVLFAAPVEFVVFRLMSGWEWDAEFRAAGRRYRR